MERGLGDRELDNFLSQVEGEAKKNHPIFPVPLNKKRFLAVPVCGINYTGEKGRDRIEHSEKERKTEVVGWDEFDR